MVHRCFETLSNRPLISHMGRQNIVVFKIKKKGRDNLHFYTVILTNFHYL